MIVIYLTASATLATPLIRKMNCCHPVYLRKTQLIVASSMHETNVHASLHLENENLIFRPPNIFNINIKDSKK